MPILTAGKLFGVWPRTSVTYPATTTLANKSRAWVKSWTLELRRMVWSSLGTNTLVWISHPHAASLLICILETDWRKNPTHQGWFLLDAGVHFTAGLRLLLGRENTVNRLSAFSTQLQPHLPPIDTVDAVLKTKSNVTGTVSISFGSTFTGSEYAIACEGGSVSVCRKTVTTVFDGREEVKTVKNERTGVPPEVRDWGEALASGKRNDRQIPEEALADLELVSRKSFRSVAR